LAAFRSFDSLRAARGNSCEVADEISVTAEDFIVLFYRWRETLYVRCEQLQTLRLSLMSFADLIQAFIDRHFYILLPAQSHSIDPPR